MVLTVTDNIMTSGQPVTTLNSHGGPNQLWYEDKINNVIRSKGDDNMALDIVGMTALLEASHRHNHLTAGAAVFGFSFFISTSSTTF